MRIDFIFKRFSQFVATKEEREKVKHQVKLLSVISTHHIVTIIIHNFAKTGKHFKEIVCISQKPHEGLLSFISVNYNTNIIFLFPQAKNQKHKPAPEDFQTGNVTFLSQHWLVELIANMISFHLKYGCGFVQFTIIIVLVLLNESCSAEGEDKTYMYNQQK